MTADTKNVVQPPVEGIDLKTFVQSVLVDTIAAVQGARMEIQALSLEGVINPVDPARTYGNEAPIEFDVAVTVGRSTDGGGKAGLKVPFMDIGASGEINRQHTAESVSRIRFSVVVAFPPTYKDVVKDRRRLQTPNNVV